MVQVPVGFVRLLYGEDTIEEGIMRCDYLGLHQTFCGLKISPDKESHIPVNWFSQSILFH